MVIKIIDVELPAQTGCQHINLTIEIDGNTENHEFLPTHISDFVDYWFSTHPNEMIDAIKEYAKTLSPQDRNDIKAALQGKTINI